MVDARHFKISDAIEEVWNSGVRKLRGEYQDWAWEPTPDQKDAAGHIRLEDYGQKGVWSLEAACAVGAACYARDPHARIRVKEDAEALLPQLCDIVDYDYDNDPVYLVDLIIDMNDDEDLTPDEIVRHLRGLGY